MTVGESLWRLSECIFPVCDILSSLNLFYTVQTLSRQLKERQLQNMTFGQTPDFSLAQEPIFVRIHLDSVQCGKMKDLRTGFTQ